MSADNTIAIARFLNPKEDSKYEYRVAHCQNIEDCEYTADRPQEVTDANRLNLFWKLERKLKGFMMK